MPSAFSKQSLSILTIAVALSFFLSFCSSSEPKPSADTIATVGTEYSISFSELKEFTTQNFYDQRFYNPADGYEHALELMINNQLRRLDFFDRGLHQQDHILQSIRRTINEEIIVELYDTEYLNPYINEEQIREAYEAMGKDVVYQQIVRNKPSNNDEALSALRNEITDLRNRIDAGEDFGQLAREYSDHQESARTNGYMSPITWESSLASSKNRAIFEMQENEIQTLESSRSYTIVKVTSINEREKPALDDVRDEIRSTLRERYTDASLQDYERDRDNAIPENEINWNEESLTIISDWTANQAGFFPQEYQDTFQNYAQENDPLIILTFEDYQVDLNEFERLLDEILILESDDRITVRQLKSYFLDAIRTDYMVQRGLDLGLQENILHPHTSNPVLRSQLAILYNRYSVEPEIPDVTEEDLRSFHEQQQDSFFYQLHTINTYVMVSPDRETAEQRIQRLENGESWDEVSGRHYLVRSFFRDRDGEIKSLNSREFPYLGETAFGLEEGDVAGPVSYQHEEHGQQYAVVKNIRVREERPLSYDEVSHRITDDFTSFHRAKIREERFSKLRETHNVRIYQDHLRQQLEQAGVL